MINNQQNQQSTLQNNAEDQKKNRSGTGFVNLNRIMGASSGQRLGQAVSGGVQNQLSTAKNNLQNAQSQFQQQSQQKALGTEAQKQEVSSAIQNAANVDDNTVKNFENYRRGEYQGPKTLSNEQQILNQAQQAQNLTQLGSSGSGRQALLQRFVGGEGYNPGMQRLDSLFLARQGNDLGKLRTAGSQNLLEAGRQVEAARGKGQELTQQAKQFGTDVLSQLGTAQESQMGDLDARIQAVNAYKQKVKEEAAKNFQAQGGLNQAELERLGMGGVDRQYYANLNNYLKDLTDVNRGTVASEDEYKKVAGLAKLTGSDATELQKQLYSQLGDVTQADLLAKQGIIGTDRERLNQDLAAAQGSYLDALKSKGTSEAFEGATNVSRVVAPLAQQIGELDKKIKQIQAQPVGNGPDKKTIEENKAYQIAQLTKQIEANKQQLNSYISQNPNAIDKFGSALYWDLSKTGPVGQSSQISAKDFFADPNKFKDAQLGNSSTGLNNINDVYGALGRGLQGYDANTVQREQQLADTRNEYGYNRKVGTGDVDAAALVNAATSQTVEARKAAIQQYLNRILGVNQ